MVELVDTLDLKSNAPWSVRVQVPPSVLKSSDSNIGRTFFNEYFTYIAHTKVETFVFTTHAEVVELVDTLDLKSNAPWSVRVQVPPSVLKP